MTTIAFPSGYSKGEANLKSIFSFHDARNADFQVRA